MLAMLRFSNSYKWIIHLAQSGHVTKGDCRSLRRLLKLTIDYLKTVVASSGPPAGGVDEANLPERRIRCDIQYRDPRKILLHVRLTLL